MDTRRVAFILYLVPKIWSEKDGGALRFFKTREEDKVRIFFLNTKKNAIVFLNVFVF
jgi:Rps23 Pro-64 3,4-dihydroxylase Tpa1-like proline 4-hydroxylase